jgi:hypothetical protein
MWPIACACEASSVTARLGLRPRKGGTLILVPASLLGRWEAEWRALGVDKQVRLRLYIHHRDYPRCNIETAQLVDLALQVVEGEGPSAKTASPAAGVAHQFMVLSTVESYYNRIQQYCGHRRRWRAVEGFPTDQDCTDGLAWARVIRDEAHMVSPVNTTLHEILNSLIFNGWEEGPPNIIPITATPMLRNGVTDMIPWVKIINLISPNISQYLPCAVFAEPTYLEELQRLQRRVTEVEVTGHGVHNELEASLVCARGRLIAAYCIRRRNDTRQNNRGLAWIPPLERYDVACPTEDLVSLQPLRRIEGILKARVAREWKWQLAQWKLQHLGGPEPAYNIKSLLSIAKMSRVLATIPGLATYGTRDTWNWDRIKARRWHLRPASSPIYRDLDSLRRSSGKLQKLQLLLQELGVDVHGQPELLVVVSRYPIICLAVLCVSYLTPVASSAMWRLLISSQLCTHEDIACEWMHADLDSIAREALVSTFQRLRGPERGVGRGTPPRVLTGTTAILGQGITLNKAYRLVLMEPDQNAAVEDQVADRIHRIGSESDRCCFYRFCNPDSALERLLIRSQGNQTRLQLQSEWLNADFRKGDEDLELLGYKGEPNVDPRLPYHEEGEKQAKEGEPEEEDFTPDEQY